MKNIILLFTTFLVITSVDNFILDIRKKIEKSPSNPKYIISVSGVGYKFNP